MGCQLSVDGGLPRVWFRDPRYCVAPCRWYRWFDDGFSLTDDCEAKDQLNANSWLGFRTESESESNGVDDIRRLGPCDPLMGRRTRWPEQ